MIEQAKIPETNDNYDEWKELMICTAITENQEMIPEINHIQNKSIKKEVEYLVKEYKPNKTKESPIELKIILTDDIPVSQRARRLPPNEKDIVENQIKEWLQDGIITHSNSDYAVPILAVPKKDGSIRVCVDYRPINRKIIKDRYPLPNIEEQIDRLQGAKIYSTLDLANGFFHIPVSQDSRKYTSFITLSGQYEYLRAPFGLCLCPPVFQRFINTIFAELISNGIVIPYMDDIVIPSQTEQEALEKLKQVLKVAEEFGLNIKWKKCTLLQRRIEFLGYEIEGGKIRPSPLKTNAVKNYKQPNTLKELQRFLGLTGYFRKFIYNYASIAKPLSDLFRKGNKFEFGFEQKTAFQKLIKLITDRPVLAIFQYGLETEVHTDASKHAIAAILMQRNNEDDELHPVRYLSLKTSVEEEKWSSYELEVLAVVNALTEWRVYLVGSPFKLITDCKAFEATMSKKGIPKIARWAMKLQEFDMKVIHRAGSKMRHVDALSRVCPIQTDDLLGILRKNQEEDENLKNIIEKLNKQETYENYEIKNNLLYRQTGREKLIVIPELMEFEIIKRAHDLGHFKQEKMEEIITRDFYIPKLNEKIKRYVKNCITCILSDRKTGKKEGFLHPISKEDGPLSTLHLDHLGPLATTKKNYKYILTIVDAFTKFVWIFPVKATTSEETIKKLRIVTSLFGNPSRIITDRGTAFTSSDFKQLCKDENIELIHITTGIPRGNGQVERIHRTIISVLTKLSIEDPEKWFQQTTQVQLFLNSTHQRSIGMTPAKLLFGVPIRTKDDIKLREMIEQEIIDIFYEEREKLRNIAKEQILKIQATNKKEFDAKRKEGKQYQIGDQVAIKRTQFGTGLKLRPKNLGPYQITKCKGNERYDVQKIGIHEGPHKSSSNTENMIPWPDYKDKMFIGVLTINDNTIIPPNIEITNQSRGALIIIEGCDKVGKTTQCERLIKSLTEAGHKIKLMRFPNRTSESGILINSYLTNKKELSDEAIHLLFAANRWEAKEDIEKTLNEGTTIIIDRYSYSGIAYSVAKGLNIEWCKSSEKGLPKPDLVLLLTMDIPALQTRYGPDNEKYEEQNFQYKVKDTYDQIKESHWKEINANASIIDLHTEILSYCIEAIKTKNHKKPKSTLSIEEGTTSKEFTPKRNNKNTKTILVEGNIASGKTTFLKYLQNHDNIEVFFEPVESWRNLNGSNLLKLMYQDPEKWIFHFQSYATLTILENHLKKCPKNIKIMERSIYSARHCFLKMLYETNKIRKESYDILNKWYEFAENQFEFQPDGIIYLKTAPKVAYQRVKLRGRKEEASITENYLQQLHDYHESWLNQQNKEIPVLVLNGDLNEELIQKEYEKIKNFTFKLQRY